MYFFDLDGTLLDSNHVWVDIDMEFLGRLGISPVPQDYTDYVTHHNFQDGAEYTRRRFGLDMTPEEIIQTWRDMAAEAYLHHLPLKPGAREFLERANNAGKRCALLTSCMPNLCRPALDRHGLNHLLEHIFIAGEVGLPKESPALYRRVAQLCGLEPGECILLDDSPVYAAAAWEAGWQVYGIADPIFDDRRDELAQLCGPGRFPFDFSMELP